MCPNHISNYTFLLQFTYVVPTSPVTVRTNPKEIQGRDPSSQQEHSKHKPSKMKILNSPIVKLQIPQPRAPRSFRGMTAKDNKATPLLDIIQTGYPFDSLSTCIYLRICIPLNIRVIGKPPPQLVSLLYQGAIPKHGVSGPQTFFKLIVKTK